MVYTCIVLDDPDPSHSLNSFIDFIRERAEFISLLETINFDSNGVIGSHRR